MLAPSSERPVIAQRLHTFSIAMAKITAAQLRESVKDYVNAHSSKTVTKSKVLGPTRCGRPNAHLVPPGFQTNRFKQDAFTINDLNQQLSASLLLLTIATYDFSNRSLTQSSREVSDDRSDRSLTKSQRSACVPPHGLEQVFRDQLCPTAWTRTAGKCLCPTAWTRTGLCDQLCPTAWTRTAG